MTNAFGDDDFDPLYDPDYEPSEPDELPEPTFNGPRFGITESEGCDPF